ncbi:MAG: hypothetical protein FD164_1803 [Nitrospirae bacterium]|nr:MAG: hypothetical protein FD164_1803 [Nitrospirota bacterium]
MRSPPQKKSAYFDVFIGAPQQRISHMSTHPHALSTVTISPHETHANLLPCTFEFFFAAGFGAVFTALFGAHFFVPHFFAGAAFFGAASFMVFVGAAAFFVAMPPPLQVE